MKTLSLCLCTIALSLGSTVAQRQIEVQISKDIKPSPAQFGEVSEDDKRTIISKVAQLLGQHVTFRGNGISSSFSELRGQRQYVEWRNLRIKMLVPTKLTPTDEGQGINKRIQAMLVFDECRLLDPSSNTWSSWKPQGHPLFPPAINVAWKNGHPIADGGMHLPKFKKGPLVPQSTATTQPLTPATSTTGKAPAGGGFEKGTGTGGLPPGMQRK